MIIWNVLTDFNILFWNLLFEEKNRIKVLQIIQGELIRGIVFLKLLKIIQRRIEICLDKKIIHTGCF